MLYDAIAVQTLNGLQDERMQAPLALVQQASIRDLVGQRVLERVLWLREKRSLVQELGRLKDETIPAAVRRQSERR